MNRFWLHISVLFFLCISCVDSFQGAEPEQLPKLYEIYDYRTDKITFETDWVECTRHTINISPTAKIDSIIFEAGLRSQSDDEHAIARLYNYTDDKPINGTTLQSRVRYVTHTIYTRDIQRNFPKKELQIGAQLRSSASNHFAQLQNVKVIVYYTRD